MVDGFHLLRPELLWVFAICPVVALALWYRRAHQGDWSRAYCHTCYLIKPPLRDATAYGFPCFCSALQFWPPRDPACSEWNCP